MKKIIALSLLTILLISLPTSCKKDKGTPLPALPLASTMKIDFSNFESVKKSGDILISKGTQNSNFEFAALVAGYWDLILFTTLWVPVRSYELAIDQTPVSINDNTWQWNYTATVSTVSYKARLTGQTQGSNALWNMYITKEGIPNPFSEFLWFSGTSKLDGTGGQWILNLSSADQVPILQIDWTGTSFNAETIKYTYVKTGESWNGSYIEYRKTTGTYDASYTVHYWNGSVNSVVNIEWSTTGNNGRVKCVDEFGDTEWHLWNSNYVNV